MSISLELVFDLTLPGFAAHPAQEHYAAMLDMCAWADAQGFQATTFGEHHTTDSNYLPSPIVVGAAVGARTRRMQIRLILLAPFYNPLRLAEDLAVVSLTSADRVFAVIAAGYRRAEFDMYGVRIEDRASAVEETVHVLREAWSGEPFKYRGRTIDLVSPVPKPQPRIIIGGSTPMMARKAAAIADGFSPSTKPGLYDVYRTEVKKLGREDPGPIPSEGPGFLFVAKDPERAWEQVAPNVLYTTRMYGKWMAEDGKHSSDRFPPASTIDELKKRSAGYAVVTPEQCLALIEGLGDGARLRVGPMPAGMDPALAWSSLELFEKKVRPFLDVKFNERLMY